MKKTFALMIVAILCLTVFHALAEDNTENVLPSSQEAQQETVQLEIVTMDDGFTFAFPSEWQYIELTQEERAQGIVLFGMDMETGMYICFLMKPGIEGVGIEELAIAMAGDKESNNYAEIVENNYGQKVILFETADRTMTGFYLMDKTGCIYIFNYGYQDESVIAVDDLRLKELLKKSFENTYFSSPVPDTQE